MVRFFHFRYFESSRRGSVTVLAFVLGCGFLIGSLFAAVSSRFGIAMIRTAAACDVSLISLLSVMILPFLFTAFAVYVRQAWLLIPIAYVKAFAFSYLCTGILHLYGAAGWLILTLLLFSDCLTLPLLCWVWIRVLSCGYQNRLRYFSVAFILLFGIAFIDHHFISPYLVGLLS